MTSIKNICDAHRGFSGEISLHVMAIQQELENKFKARIDELKKEKSKISCPEGIDYYNGKIDEVKKMLNE